MAHFWWVPIVDAVLILTLLVGAPLIAGAMARASWKGWPSGFRRETFFLAFVATMASAGLLIAFATSMRADVRTWRYGLEAICFESGFALVGVAGGWVFGIFLHNGRSVQSTHAGRSHRHSVIRPRYWALIIAGVTAGHLWFFFHLGSNAVLTDAGIAIHVTACLGPFWMLADWFKHRHALGLKRWLWMFFVPWGFLWYYIEIHRQLQQREQIVA